MDSQLVKIPRETLAEFMNCPLCDKVLEEATTLPECLHSFCRKCIFEKLTNEGEDCCPICHMNLGIAPEEKLRPDHNLQDVTSKIFPLNREKVEAPEPEPEVTALVRTKEQSLSSLVVSAPRISPNTSLSRRGTEGIEKNKNLENGSENSSSSESLSKITQKRRQVEEENIRTVGDSLAEKIDCWNPLEGEVRAPKSKVTIGTDSTPLGVTEPKHSMGMERRRANFTGEVGGSSQAILGVVDSKITNGTNSAPLGVTEPKNSLRVGSKVTNSTSSTRLGGNAQAVPGAVGSKVTNSTKSNRAGVKGPKKSPGMERRGAKSSGERGGNAQAVLRALGVIQDKPIWFKLLASEHQEGDAPLPQIASRFIKIKDVNMAVSYIQKYLKQKLNLQSETEVEIQCRGVAVIPTLPLSELMDMWLETTPSTHIRAKVGSSAEDFIMELTYSRKI